MQGLVLVAFFRRIRGRRGASDHVVRSEVTDVAVSLIPDKHIALVELPLYMMLIQFDVSELVTQVTHPTVRGWIHAEENRHR